MTQHITRIQNAPQLADGTVMPYARACVTGKLVFTSGQLPLDASGKMVAGGIQEQTHQVMHNIEGLLAEAGCTMADVVKITAWLVDLGDFAEYNQAYRSHFNGAFPARSTTGGAQLPLGARVEIEAIAVIPGHDDAAQR